MSTKNIKTDVETRLAEIEKMPWVHQLDHVVWLVDTVRQQATEIERLKAVIAQLTNGEVVTSWNPNLQPTKGTNDN